MVLVLATAGQMLEAAWPAAPIPGELVVLQNALAPLRIANTYGLFAVMTTRRPEITVEGSEDGSSWRPYRFRWKPCELDRRPRFAPFHLPRLDWQMWFAALGGDCRWPAVVPPVRAAPPRGLATRPGPAPRRSLPRAAAPAHPGAARTDYRFTRWGSRDWWERTELGLFCPAVS